MILATLVCLNLFKPSTITFVRHAETVANATGSYNSRTINAFSARGIQQTGKLTKQLNEALYDHILVSPSPRALKTLAPFLSQTGQVAEVWPELYECCHQPPSWKNLSSPLQVRFGSKIKWPEPFDGLFAHRPGGERYIHATTYAQGLNQIKLAYKMILREFSGSGKHVLIVGHSIQGGKMIALLTKAKVIPVENAKPIRLIEKEPGIFTVR
jgi:broad specificity phosphatase PhoE